MPDSRFISVRLHNAQRPAFGRRDLTLDDAGDGSLALAGVAEERNDLDAGEFAPGQSDGKAGLTAGDEVARRLDDERVTRPQALRAAAAHKDLITAHLQYVGEPRPLLQLLDDVRHQVRDRG